MYVNNLVGDIKADHRDFYRYRHARHQKGVISRKCDMLTKYSGTMSEFQNESFAAPPIHLPYNYNIQRHTIPASGMRMSY